MSARVGGSHRAVKAAAAAVWYVGGVALLAKGVSLLGNAAAVRPGAAAILASAGIGVTAGILKARLLFLPACARNLRRIHRLHRPRVWQCYRPQFFGMLALMIALGALLSGAAAGTYGRLLAVGALDLSLATALLGSSVEFWTPATDV